MEEGALGARGSRPELSEEDVNVLKDHLRRQKAVFKLQVSLLDQGRVSVERVRAAVRRFQPSDLDDLAEERKLIGLCGYPLCGKAPTTKVPNVRVVDVTRRRIVDAEQARRFCSMDCLHRLELIKVQVPANSPDSRIEIPLMDGSSDKEVATEEANARATQQSAQAVASVVSSNAPIIERQVDPNAQSESFPAAGSRQIVEQLRELGIHEDDDFASAARVATKAASSRGEMESGPGESRESEEPVVVEEQQNEEDKDESEIEESINRMNEMNESEDEDVDEEEAKGEIESGSNNVSGEDAADDEVDFAPGMDLFDVSTLSEDIAGFEFTPLMRYTDVFNAWTSAERGKAALDGAEFDSFASYVRVGFAEISAALAMAPPQPPSGPLTTISESA
ncbi:RNA polymerase II subunit B1 CTD phosphatase Rpap2 [Hondaea fermentalgiana]|uniref:RNA polymerase II subunit B1 CTD phosphatase RPAP2 homolog n=1 Tax=Hondaea fermentalgiana TaxID=2315210 RepID=A0A2R5GN34_9STRA|nr:RNA polymerase II subunit B1 CTD phosphatase Rpap2 [Hondaea fermentalgiana]|eukprot:GBG32307.1 RNA polymerase II subunit B1 CTD phosphatase Rpap2 [Hondaea fermentalgiana]